MHSSAVRSPQNGDPMAMKTEWLLSVANNLIQGNGPVSTVAQTQRSVPMPGLAPVYALTEHIPSKSNSCWRVVNEVAADVHVPSSVEMSPDTSDIDDMKHYEEIDKTSAEAEAESFLRKWRSASLNMLTPIHADPSSMFMPNLTHPAPDNKENMHPFSVNYQQLNTIKDVPLPRAVPSLVSKKIQVAICQCMAKKSSSSTQTFVASSTSCGTSTMVSSLNNATDFVHDFSGGTQGANQLANLIGASFSRLVALGERNQCHSLCLELRRMCGSTTTTSGCQTVISGDEVQFLADSVETLTHRSEDEQGQVHRLQAILAQRDREIQNTMSDIEDLRSQLLDSKISIKMISADCTKHQTALEAKNADLSATKDRFRELLAGERAKVAVLLQSVEAKLAVLSNPTIEPMLAIHTTRNSTAPPSPSRNFDVRRALNSEFQSPAPHARSYASIPLTIVKEKAEGDGLSGITPPASSPPGVQLNSPNSRGSDVASLFTAKWAAVEERLNAIEEQYMDRWEATENRLLESIVGHAQHGESRSNDFISPKVELALLQREYAKAEANVSALREALHTQANVSTKAAYAAQQQHLAEIEVWKNRVASTQHRLELHTARGKLEVQEFEARWSQVASVEQTEWSSLLSDFVKVKLCIETAVSFGTQTSDIRHYDATLEAHERSRLSSIGRSENMISTPRTVSKQVTFTQPSSLGSSQLNKQDQKSFLSGNSLEGDRTVAKSILKDLSPTHDLHSTIKPPSAPMNWEQRASLMELLQLCDDALA